MSGRHSHLESEDLGSVLCSPQASAEGGEGQLGFSQGQGVIPGEILFPHPESCR